MAYGAAFAPYLARWVRRALGLGVVFPHEHAPSPERLKYSSWRRRCVCGKSCARLCNSCTVFWFVFEFDRDSHPERVREVAVVVFALDAEAVEACGEAYVVGRVTSSFCCLPVRREKTEESSMSDHIYASLVTIESTP